jgi:PAT family beta-lactamase induction signal transducer AmpG
MSISSLAALHRLLAVTLLGFASGLPLALTGQAMQAWLTADGIDLATIGFLSLVGLPYTFKFLWAPLMDRFDLPGLGRRRGWLVLTQLALAGALLALSLASPKDGIRLFALLAVTVAFVSASQDVVIDAWRTDVLPPAERGLGASLNVMGYRLAMIVARRRLGLACGLPPDGAADGGRGRGVGAAAAALAPAAAGANPARCRRIRSTPRRPSGPARLCRRACRSGPGRGGE